MKAHLIHTHLLIPRSSAKVKVKYQGHVSQKMGVSGAFMFHKHILLTELSPFDGLKFSVKIKLLMLSLGTGMSCSFSGFYFRVSKEIHFNMFCTDRVSCGFTQFYMLSGISRVNCRFTLFDLLPGILEREQEQSVVYGSIDFGKTVVTSEKYRELVRFSWNLFGILCCFQHYFTFP